MNPLQRATNQWRDRRLVKKYGQSATNANTIVNYQQGRHSDSYAVSKAYEGTAMGAYTKVGSRTEKLLKKPKKLARVNKAMYGKPGRPAPAKEPDTLF